MLKSGTESCQKRSQDSKICQYICLKAYFSITFFIHKLRNPMRRGGGGAPKGDIRREGGGVGWTSLKANLLLLQTLLSVSNWSHVSTGPYGYTNT